PMSRRISVPLAPPPSPPGAPSITYDERAISVTWTDASPPISGEDAKDVLPSRVLGVARPAIAYNVYDATHSEAPLKLTASPIAELKYTDARITRVEKRCYTVRAAETIAAATIDSDPGPVVCTRNRDGAVSPLCRRG